MKKWGLGILAALLSFVLGLCATTIVRISHVPAEMPQPVDNVTNIKDQIPLAEFAKGILLTDEIMRPHAVEISPYEIKRLIDENRRTVAQQSELDFKPIWEELGINDNNTTSFTMNQCTGYCEANIFTIELDGQPGKETILRLYAAATWDYRYLIFKQDNSQRGANSVWVLLGYVDAFVRYAYPKHRVVTAGTQRWLAIGCVSGYGSAFGSDAEDWYEVGSGGVRNVLSYQTRLFIGLSNPEIKRKSRVTKVEYRDGIATVIIEISTSYEGLMEKFRDRFPLWEGGRRMTFIKGPGMSEFMLDKQHSELLEEELDPRFGDDEGISNEDFLKYNYRELTRLAISGNAKQKEWLRDFIKDCDETLEKQSLQTALGGALP